MNSFALVLFLCSLSVSIASDSKSYNGYVTKVKEISRVDVEKRREEISDEMIRESDTVNLEEDDNVVNVLYKDKLLVHHREYTFDVPESAHAEGKCTFGPITKEHKPVYHHVRDLTSDENRAYLNKNSSERVEYSSSLGRPNDTIVPTFKMNKDGEFEKDVEENKVPNTDKFALVRPIGLVSYTCDKGTFCCGNRCCPSALKDFLKKVSDGDKEHRMNVPIGNETISLYLTPKPSIGTSKRNCGYVFESKNYFEVKDSDVDAVRYTCPKSYGCCAEALCCKNPERSDEEKSFIAGYKSILIAIFVVCGLLFVAGLWYWCHYRRHNRDPPHTYIAPETRRQSRMSRASQSSKA
uniref:CX domain-containing protein n=1 Tax=Plectus sambesii TaxID=2011161 RepID=A0A914UZT4_9BILA